MTAQVGDAQGNEDCDAIAREDRAKEPYTRNRFQIEHNLSPFPAAGQLFKKDGAGQNRKPNQLSGGDGGQKPFKVEVLVKPKQRDDRKCSASRRQYPADYGAEAGSG